MTKNKGYTLVELIIVIAIMGILSGMSFVVLGVINEARCSSAVNTLNNQISSCLIQTKAVSEVDTPMCLVIKKRASDGLYVLRKGIIDASGNVTLTGTDEDENCEAVLPSQISYIKYTPLDDDQKVSEEQMVIQFVKSDGSVRYGAGQYDLCTDKDGLERYASIYLDAVSGKHYIK